MRRHRVDPVSLVFGLGFAGVVGWWGLSQVVHLQVRTAAWFLAVGLLVAGVIGLASLLRAGRGNRHEHRNAEGGWDGESRDP